MELLNLRKHTDVVLGSILSSGLEDVILDCPIVSRMHRIRQNSLVFLTFPSNKTMRFEHSLGTMELAGRIFYAAVANTEPAILEKFLRSVLNELQPWANKLKQNQFPNLNGNFFGRRSSDSITIKNLEGREFPYSNFYGRFTPPTVSNEFRFIYTALFQGVRLAGLLHDLGHLPYSHTLEKVLKRLNLRLQDKHVSFVNPTSEQEKDALIERCKDLFDSTQEDWNNLPNAEKALANEIMFLSMYEEFCSPLHGKEIHEELGKRILFHVRSYVLDKIKTTDVRSELALILVAFRVAGILLNIQFELDDSKEIEVDYTKSTIYDLRYIISGLLDADRLDYASRDLFMSGIRKDPIDYTRIFSHISIKSLKLLDENIAVDSSNAAQGAEHFLIVLESRAVRDVEEFLYRRWNIYRDMNYHHSVNKSETLMVKALLKDSIERLNSSEKINLSDDSIPLKFIEGIMWILDNLNNQGNNKALMDAIVQLDDGWLDTSLKRGAKPGDVLNELISHRREYSSLIKRFDDFSNFDRMLFDKFKNSSDVQNILNIIQEKINAHFNSQSQKLIEELDSEEKDSIISQMKESTKSFITDIINKDKSVCANDFIGSMEDLLTPILIEFDERYFALRELYIVLNNSYMGEDYNTYFFEEKKSFCQYLVDCLRNICNEETFLQKFESHINENNSDMIGIVDFNTGIPHDAISLPIKNGTQIMQPYPLYIDTGRIHNGNSEYKKFVDYSIIDLMLVEQRQFIPMFHFYIKRNESTVSHQEKIEWLCNEMFSAITRTLSSCFSMIATNTS